jgi:hypothetical protein
MLDMQIMDPQSGEVIYRVPPTFGAYEEPEDPLFDTPPFQHCADPARVAMYIGTAPHDKNDLLLGCFVRAYYQYATDPRGGLEVARRMIQMWKDDPALTPPLDEAMQTVISKFGVTREFIDLASEPAAPPKAFDTKKLAWAVGGLALFGAVIAGTVMITRSGE